MIKTNYDPRIGAEFILDCAKHGKVRVLSRQVTISSDNGKELNLETLLIPDFYRIQFVNTALDGRSVSITLVLEDNEFSFKEVEDD